MINYQKYAEYTQSLKNPRINLVDVLMPEEDAQLAQERQAVLEATEAICENVLAKAQPVGITYEEFRVASKTLLDAVHYYHKMFKLFSSSVNGVSEDLQDYEYILNVRMSGVEEYQTDYTTIQITQNIMLKNTYNRVYSALIMLLGVANIMFPDKYRQIQRIYKKLPLQESDYISETTQTNKVLTNP